MRASFGRIVEIRQGNVRAVPAPERQRNQVVGKPWILRQKWSVEVRSKGVTVSRTFQAILAVISGSDYDPSEWLTEWTEIGSSTVIFEANQFQWPPIKRPLDHGIANVAARTGHRPSVKHGNPRQFRAGSRSEVPPQELIGSANGQGHQVGFDRVLQRSAGISLKVAADRDLVAILATPGEDQIERLEGDRIPNATFDNLDGNPPPATPLDEGRDVASVAVHVHSRRVQVTQGQRQTGPGSEFHQAHPSQYLAA
jgi:hypothetical protein